MQLSTNRVESCMSLSDSACVNNLNGVLKKILNTKATILISGESGTGKSALARRIHHLSKIAQGRFVEVQCTSLPENLLESELFGHEKGSFTGADKSKVGKVEYANNGTLFLDEIGDLSLSGQTKLLRLLQERVITRVGGNNDIEVNARIILATNKNLTKLVEQGKFRSDLYFRMNIFECHLPPLVSRQNDIKGLVAEFLKENQLALEVDKEFVLSTELMDVILSYPWPGNIRELQNVIKRLCYLADNEYLELTHLPPYMNYKEIKTQVRSDETLLSIERQHIEYILKSEKCLEKAAQTLGITSVTLWRKRKIYNLA